MPDKDTDSSVIESCFFGALCRKRYAYWYLYNLCSVLFWSNSGIAKLHLAL